VGLIGGEAVERMRSGIITQPNYIPWRGYFDQIAKTDVYVIYDDVQYTKRDWRNRNKIKTPNGTKWLTIPVQVKGNFNQKIKDVKIADKSWPKSHWGSIKQFYKDCYGPKDTKDWLENLYLTTDEDFLIDINFKFTAEILKYLNIEREICFSSNFSLSDGKNKRLIDLCKKLNITSYWSGPAAKDYIDTELFKEQGINVNYFDPDYKKLYPQLFPPFNEKVSIIDLLLNTGPQAKEHLLFADE